MPPRSRIFTYGLCFFIVVVTNAWAQQPQTSGATNGQNASYLQGVGTGYWPTAGSGLTLNLTVGTVNAGVPPAPVNYPGGTLGLAGSATNYVYLLPSGPGAPAMPNLSTSTTGGSLAAGTYKIEITYTNPSGQTLASTEASITTTGSTSTITVTSPTSSLNATGWNAYATAVGGGSGTETKQNSSSTAIGTNFTFGSVISGGTLPSKDTSGFAPWFNTTGFQPGYVPIATVATSSSAITLITDVRTWFADPNIQGPVVRADLMPGADAAAKINACIKALPSAGSTCDARGLTVTQTLGSDVFAGITTASGTLLLGPGTFTVSATQNVPPSWRISGAVGGGPPAGLSAARWGTRLVAASGFAGPVFKFNDVFTSKFEGIQTDCGSQSGSVGIQYTSDGQPPGYDSSQNEFTNFGIYNCLYGFQIGNVVTDSTYNANQMDQLTVRRFQIVSPVAGAEAFTFNSGNAAQAGIFEEGAIQGVNIGFDLRLYGGIAQWKRVVFGGLANDFLSISNTTGSGTSPIVVTTSAAHGHSTNDQVIIAGVTGDTNANGTWTITVGGSCNGGANPTTTFCLNTSTGAGTSGGGGTATRVSVSGASYGSGTVNVTSNTTVTFVSGASSFDTTWPSGTPITINGVVYVIASVSSSTSLTLQSPGAANQTGVSFSVPIVVTTSGAHGYVSGQRMRVAGVGGNTAANGNWYVTVLTSTQFYLNNSTGNGTYSSGGTSTRLATAYSLTSSSDYWIEDSQSESGAREGNISYATNANPIVIIQPNHPFQTGDGAAIAGVGGNTNANGTWVVTKIDSNSFSLNGRSGNANYTSGGTALHTVTGATNPGQIVVTVPNHGYQTGDVVNISGVQGNTAANSMWQITVVDSNSFQLNGSSGNGTFSCGGTTPQCSGTSQRMDVNFINVNGSPYNGAGITLLHNVLDEPVVVNRGARITSIDNFGPAPGVSQNASVRIVSINDRFTNPGPMAGWDTSAGGQVLRLGGGDRGSDVVSITSPASITGAGVYSTTRMTAGANAVTANGSTITVDASLGNTQEVTLSASTTLSLSNCQAGQWLTFDIIEDATGGRTFSWSTSYFKGGTNFSTAPATNAGEHNRQSFYCDGTYAWAVSSLVSGQ